MQADQGLKPEDLCNDLKLIWNESPIEVVEMKLKNLTRIWFLLIMNAI